MTDEITHGLGSQPPTPPIQPSYNEQNQLNGPDSSAVSPASALATPQPQSLENSPTTTPDTQPVPQVRESVESGKEAVNTEDREEVKDQKAQDRDRSEIPSLPPRLDHYNLEPQDENIEVVGAEMTQAGDGPTIQVHSGGSQLGPVSPMQENVGVDPRVAEMKVMFPDFDAIVL